MKIVVMCETQLQFNNYVLAAFHNDSELSKRTMIRKYGSDVVIHTEDIEFIYCNYPDTLRGRTFGKNDRIIKVGSWYNILKEIQEEIVTSFMTRIEK